MRVPTGPDARMQHIMGGKPEEIVILPDWLICQLLLPSCTEKHSSEPGMKSCPGVVIHGRKKIQDAIRSGPIIRFR